MDHVAAFAERMDRLPGISLAYFFAKGAAMKGMISWQLLKVCICFLNMYGYIR